MKIAFHTPSIDVRGTCVALYDYANYNELLLNNNSIIITPYLGLNISDNIAINKFKNRFNIYYYNTLDDLEKILKNNNVNILYTIKYGKNDGIYSKNIKTIIHCVFDMTDKHGDIYAGVSKTLANKFNSNLYVPHMISLQPSNECNLRDILNIPKNAIVYGRHGGMDTFNLKFAYNSIIRTLKDNKNIYFIFINTPCYFAHSHIYYIYQICSEKEKNRFISTCDAYIECGTMGHTFGLSIAEFSIHNKPVIAYNGDDILNKAHIDILGDKGIYYKTEDELYNILTNFIPENYKFDYSKLYDEYKPEKVMKKFNDVFLI
jgi:hypothetical protein